MEGYLAFALVAVALLWFAVEMALAEQRSRTAEKSARFLIPTVVVVLAAPAALYYLADSWSYGLVSLAMAGLVGLAAVAFVVPRTVLRRSTGGS